jgi:UDP-N-acetylmuramoyl-tripeptide--D-alanyl-D-alanine ligase
MIARSAASLAERTGGLLEGADVPFETVVTDSRAVAAGDCFVALSGPRFDGHDFLEDVAAAGAAVALVTRHASVSLPQVRVADTLDALQRWAGAWRRSFTLPVVGITGSNGKTTLRALLEAVLAPLGPLLATRGNLNNHIGVPLTLCRLRAEHIVAVVEMGANHPGEIAGLAAMAQPEIGIVTNSGDAHLEGFGSREGAARGEGAELLEVLPASGVAIFNADDAYAELWRASSTAGRQIGFGLGPEADVTARDIRLEDAGSRFTLMLPEEAAAVSLPLPGRHNVHNALAAAAAAHALGLDASRVAAGLAQVRVPTGRLVPLTARRGARVIDDSYNANPGSLAAAVDWLAQMRGHRVLALGDMAELGATAVELHAAAGRAARAAGIEALFAAGPLAAHAAEAFGPGAEAFAHAESLAAALRERVAPDWVVLVKGSRAAAMEQVVAALRENDGSTGETHALPPR